MIRVRSDREYNTNLAVAVLSIKYCVSLFRSFVKSSDTLCLVAK